MTIADATPDLEQVDRDDRAFLGHPKGLGFLGFTEACERFSYYSMQTLLVSTWSITCSAGAHGQGRRPAMGAEPRLSRLLGPAARLGDLRNLRVARLRTPILGGIIADKWLGRDRTLILGGISMAIGHFLMAIQSAFVFALIALCSASAPFKGNIATQVGALYGPHDLRRAMAFQIFYIFINVSVIVAPLISGTLGQKVGWHYGFGCAGVVMVLGLFIYLADEATWRRN